MVVGTLSNTESSSALTAESKNKSLADVKRFNAQQIRRRMKEQKHRFGSKFASSSSGDSSSPTKTDAKSSENIGANHQLTIAVSLSEESEEQAPCYIPTKQSLSANIVPLDTDSDDQGNVSAWAMMEHYDLGATGLSPRRRFDLRDSTVIDSSSSPLIKDASSFWNRSFTQEHGSLQLSPQSQDVSRATPSTITRTTQQVFVPNESRVTPPAGGEDEFDWNLESSLHAQASDTAASKSQEALLFQDNESTVDDRPTPTKLKAYWIEEKRLAYNSKSPPVSLLQESLILSDRTGNMSSLASAHAIETENAAESVDETKDSASEKLMSHAENEYKNSFQIPTNPEGAPNHLMTKSRQTQGVYLGPYTHPPLADGTAVVLRDTAKCIARSDFAHLERIDQLEQSLKEQRQNTEQTQSRLRERVVELEHALRATAATPRGTMIEENPLKTLLDRNQTLVKEVRFADSTCVELSAKVSALESEKNILQDQVKVLKDENKELRRSYEQILAENDSVHRSKLHAKSSLSPIGVIDSTFDGTFLRQTVEELRVEISEGANVNRDPFYFMATNLLSDIDTTFERDYDGTAEFPDKSFTSNCLAKAIQAQVGLIREQKLMVQYSQELENQLGLERIRYEQLATKMKEEKPPTTVHCETNLSLELSQAQDESDFLGRQLGKVQQLLDTTLQELKQEKQYSASAKKMWRAETARQLRRIRVLEGQLERVSQSLINGTEDNGGIISKDLFERKALSVDQEILNAKASLLSLKNDIGRLLSGTDELGAVTSSNNEENPEVVFIVNHALHTMRQHYIDLNSKVEAIVTCNCDRLEKLSDAVSFLRSSLLFEEESSICSKTIRSPSKGADAIATQSWETEHNEYCDDDDVYSRMEEARGNVLLINEASDDASSDWDELSRLMSEESTFASMLKAAASDKSITWDSESWKKPLEAALQECQKVREKSLSLKEELKSEKIAFAQLETENRRLVINFSRKHEEQRLVQEALDEAKLHIHHLECRISNLLEQKNQLDEKRLEEQKHFDHLEVEKLELECCLKKTQEGKRETEDRLEEMRSQIDEANSRLKIAYAEVQDRENEFKMLKQALADTEARSSEAEDLLFESRCQLEDIRKERIELRLELGKSQNEIHAVRESSSKVHARLQDQVCEKDAAIENFRQQNIEAQKAMQRLLNVYNDIVKLFDTVGSLGFPKPQGSSDAVANLDFALLDQIVPFISFTLNERDKNYAEVEELQKVVSLLQGDVKRATDLTTEYQKRIEEEKSENGKLFELVRQAEIEMERSANQIREMSLALSKLQQQESDILAKRRAAKDEAELVRAELRRTQSELCAERKSSLHKGNDFSQQLAAREKVEVELRATIEGLQTKAVKLRQYVKKLTTKCEEWETTYERQGKALEKLQSKNTRLREKAIEIAAKYKELSGHVKSKSKVHSQDKEKWVGQRNDLQRIHEQLERELETITNELSTLEQM